MTILDEILAGIAAALLVTVGVLLVMNANLRADLATARANVLTLNSVNADLKDEAEKQNQALLALKTASDARTRAAEKAVKAAQAVARRYADEAAAIAAANSDDCAAATKVLWEYLGRR